RSEWRRNLQPEYWWERDVDGDGRSGLRQLRPGGSAVAIHSVRGRDQAEHQTKQRCNRRVDDLLRAWLTASEQGGRHHGDARGSRTMLSRPDAQRSAADRKPSPIGEGQVGPPILPVLRWACADWRLPRRSLSG